MRFAVQHPVGDPAWSPAVLAPDAVRRFAAGAEAAGFAALGFTDHPAPSSRWIAAGGEGVADPFSALGYCAAVTDSIRLLTFVLVPPYRNPLLAAHQLATLDALSGGRLTVGLGTGYLFSEFHALGAEPARRRAAFDESVEVMRLAWTGRPVDHEAPTFSARGSVVLPPVVQTPHPPLWIHGNSPWGIERAGRYGQGWLGMITGDDDTIVKTTRTTALPDRGVLVKRIAEVRRAAEVAGRDPDELEIAVTGVWPMLDVRQGWSATSRLDDVAELTSIGVDWIVLVCCGDDPAAAEESVERFGSDVIAPSA